tara:strand:- start:217 stop:468 length:252 start_codon:yes stop_codon:yes gene_type:complete
MYSLTPFDMFAEFTSPFRSRVYVVSDSEYTDIKKQQTLEHIRVLETRAEDYQRNLDIITATITELKKSNGLLPASKENDDTDK